MKTTTRLRAIFASLLLGISYTSLVLEWMWVFIVGIPPLIKIGAFDILTTPAEPTATIPAEPLAASPLLTILVGAFTLFILAVTVIVLVRIPKTIVKTGEKIVQQATDAVVPVVTHHKPLPAKKKLIISRRVKTALQISASLVPALISLLLPANEELTRTVIIIITMCLSLVSIVGFVVARLLEPTDPTSRTR